MFYSLKQYQTVALIVAVMHDHRLFHLWLAKNHKIGRIKCLDSCVKVYLGYWMKRTENSKLTSSNKDKSKSHKKNHLNSKHNASLHPKKGRSSNQPNELLLICIKSGANWSDVVKADPNYYQKHAMDVWNRWVQVRNYIAFDVELMAAVSFSSPEYKALEANPAAYTAVAMSHTLFHDLEREKGIIIQYIAGDSDAGKTTFILQGVGAVITVRSIHWQQGWFVFHLHRITTLSSTVR